MWHVVGACCQGRSRFAKKAGSERKADTFALLGKDFKHRRTTANIGSVVTRMCYAIDRSCAVHEASGGGEIRTHEAFRPSGFQDRRNQPLCHPSGEEMCAGHFATGARVSKRDCGSSSSFAAQRSHLFPVGTVPVEKFLEAIDIALVKIDKILPFTASHLARIRRRTRFDIV